MANFWQLPGTWFSDSDICPGTDRFILSWDKTSVIFRVGVSDFLVVVVCIIH